MGWGAASSDSTTELTVISPDNRVNVQDQGVYMRNAGNARNVYRLGKGAQVNFGPSAAQLSAIAGQIASQVHASTPPTETQTNPGNLDPGVDEGYFARLMGALGSRVTDQVKNAPAEANKLGFHNWVLIAAGAFVLIVAIYITRKRK